MNFKANMFEGGCIFKLTLLLATGHVKNGRVNLKICKGQLISEWLIDAFNFPKKISKIWWISSLESKKWSNQQDKGTLFC